LASVNMLLIGSPAMVIIGARRKGERNGLSRSSLENIEVNRIRKERMENQFFQAINHLRI